MVAVRKDRPELRLMTLEEYFALEASSAEKYEYYSGYARAMTGASVRHNRITLNIATQLTVTFDDNPCQVFVSDLRVQLAAHDKYVYPDVSVVCGEPDIMKNGGLDTLLNPVVIFEVLSPSTAASDRGEKFAMYREVESLQEYVLVEQHTMRVEHYARQEGGKWLLTDYQGADAVVNLSAIGAVLSLRDVYRRVDFETEQT